MSTSASGPSPSSSRTQRTWAAELGPEQQALYESITGGPRAVGSRLFRIADDDGVLLGPFGTLLLSPQLGDALQCLGVAIRYRTGLSDRAREIAILVVAAHQRSAYEAYAHEAVGRSVGLTNREIAALAAGLDPRFDAPAEAAVLALTTALLAGEIDDETWYRHVPTIGEPAVFELTTLVGYYSTLALLMRVFQTDDAPAD